MLMMNQVLAFASQQFDVLLAGGLLTSAEVGLYGTAKRSLLTAAMPVQMAALTVVASVPRLYAQSRTGELQKLVRGAATAAAVPALLALAFLVLFCRPILSFLLRDEYAAASGIVVILALGYLALVALGNPQYVLTMTGRHRAVLVVNVISAVLMMSVGTIGGRLYGAVGLAGASALSMTLQNGLLWWIARRELGIWTHVTLQPAATGSTDAAGVPSSSSVRVRQGCALTPSTESLPNSSAV
jgi:O-antigen/teichoic acid export membrane protein